MCRKKTGIPGRAVILAAVYSIFVLVGCSMSSSDDVTYVVIPAGADTPGEVTSPPSSAAIATPVPPTPIPDIAPDILLQVANRELRDGYYERAIDFYRAVLARSDATPEIHAGAAFGMGKAALRAGLFQDALEALTILIQQFPTDPHATQAYFLRGDAYLGLSQWQPAIDDFQQYLALRPGLIDSYAHERIGDAQLALNLYDSAFESYTRAADSSRSLVPQLALREKVARLHVLSGNIQRAVEQYDAILAVAQNAPYRAGIEFMAAQAVTESGDINGGLDRMQRIVTQYEDRPEAYDALKTLLAYQRTVNAYVAGRVRYFAGDYAGAIEDFNVFTSQVALASIPAELHLLLGRSYRAVGNWQAAQTAFNTLIEQYPTNALFGDALLETGRTHFLNGDHDAAIARYLSIADTYNYLTVTAAQALWRAGYLYGVNGNTAQSQAVFIRLADTYPNTRDAQSGLVIAASAAMSAEDTAGAEMLYGRLAATTSGSEQADAYLHLGRLALLRGDFNAANDAFSRAAVVAPDTYFSARASDLLRGDIPFTPPAQYVFEFDDLSEITAAENWLRTTFAITQEGPLWPLSPQLEADPRIVRGRELWAVGAVDEAQTEFFDALEAYKNDGLASYQLSIFLRVIEAYYPSIVGAANVINAAKVSTLNAPAYIARMRYPIYYRDEVLRVSEHYEIDPLVFFSLIRHESLFSTHATAAAGEKGLTQVIPSTGDYIAAQLNWQDYQHRDLFRPYAGLEFGAFYLSEQLKRFGYNTYVALAGYNAGPGNALNWWQLAGDDPDQFMSTITIDSVQLYIQRIYSNYNIYRELYGVE